MSNRSLVNPLSFLMVSDEDPEVTAKRVREYESEAWKQKRYVAIHVDAKDLSPIEKQVLESIARRRFEKGR